MSANTDTEGLSPRPRGSREGRQREVVRCGSIPASAGEPVRPLFARKDFWVYPRVRGGAGLCGGGHGVTAGLSPRPRGSPSGRSSSSTSPGSIPASAGEPCDEQFELAGVGVYPRVRGGAAPGGLSREAAGGLSPRPRGSRAQDDGLPGGVGSIPASAGEPCRAAVRAGSARVYPRVRGGARSAPLRSEQLRGLSPRPRGSPLQHLAGRCKLGSIPASAGEPTAGLWLKRFQWVYPRVRGGAVAEVLEVRFRQGLSPRPRGSPAFARDPRTGVGSIPASAGEPAQGLHQSLVVAVYPRVRGGARHAAEEWGDHLGLSPRPRGSRLWIGLGEWSHGSIPASAGEPDAKNAHPRVKGVYPRVRGGADVVGHHRSSRKGLSPRPRGSRSVLSLCLARYGSIPASAGEPRPFPGGSVMRRVYPRVRGGASPALPCASAARGLSPRPRGSLPGTVRPIRPTGSIPASAGEPRHRLRWSGGRRVYPRVRGGATSSPFATRAPKGLSPRPRGSPGGQALACRWCGSIPASAGEPEVVEGLEIDRGVYPRVRGGAFGCSVVV